MPELRARLDIGTMRQVITTSVPLMFGMVGNLVMMLVDRICLARYSEDTLRASGPAVFTASTLILLFAHTAGITRSYVAQAHGRKDSREAMDEGANGVVLAALLAVVLLACAPLIARIPELSGQPEHIKALESEFLRLSTLFGAVMTLNMGLASYFNGIGRTKLPMTVGLIGQAVGVVMTPGLVFGYFGLPELGMRGSAFGTLTAVSVMLLGYVVSLPKEYSAGFARLVADGLRNAAAVLWLRLRRGAPSGGAIGLDGMGNTLFVWLAGALGAVALAANNVAVSLNYLAVIPPIGLAMGCNVLCGTAIGAGEYTRVPRIMRATFAVAGTYLAVIAFLQIVAPTVLLAPFGLNEVGPDSVASAIDTSRVLWTYGVAFMFSVVASSVLECFGLARFGFITRIVVIWGLSIPVVCWIALAHRDNADLLPVMWAVYSLFEGVVAAVCIWRIRRAVANRENQLVSVREPSSEPV